MEKIVTNELDIYMGKIRNILNNNVPEDDVLKIRDIISDSLSKMIDLLKEGKSAHEKFFSDIILNSPDAIVGLDNNYKFFLWNKGAENIFGYSLKEVMGQDFTLLIPENLLKKGEQEFLLNVISEKKFLKNYETERITKNGEIIIVSISRFPVFNSKKEMIGSVGIVRDITKEKKLEKELRENENLALIGQVVSSIAHSLANPLNIISGNTEYLLMNKEKSDKDFEGLKAIMEETNSISHLIKSILDFSRPIRLQKEELDLSLLIDQILEKIKFSFDGKKIEIRKNIIGDSFVILGDHFELKDALTNLVINSIQSIKKEPGIINVLLKNNMNNIVLTISDNGIGIKPDDLLNIFTPFYSTKEYGKGTGLGLAITNKIISEHKGEIKVQSEVNIGTTFTISFPVS